MMLCKHRFTALLAVLLLAVSFCMTGNAELATCVDWAGSVNLDMQSETAKQEVTVRTFVDGDTTHFNVPESVSESGVLKARYIAINTPESTGKIEEWGKKASNFTKEKLQSADSIFIESDSGSWNLDSTSTRDLVWVWYKPAGEENYRNLNIELLQTGLALPNNAGGNRYGEACLAAAAQARANKLHIYSGEKDPDFYYGDAIELTIKELRLHPEAYEGKKVAFSGVITVNHSNAVFIEDYDEETGLYFGFTAYYGFNLSGGGLEVLHVGNEARIVGTVQYYEAGHSWQVAGLNYRMMKPKDPGNIQKLSEGHEPSWKETAPETWGSAVSLETADGVQEEYPYPFLVLDTSVAMSGLHVTAVHDSDSGLLRYLTCGGDTKYPVLVTLAADGAFADTDFHDKTIDVRGIAEGNESTFYLRVYTPDGLTIHND